MKNLKKVLTIILALSMVASMTACGSKKTTADEKKDNDTKIEEKIDEKENEEEKSEDKKSENKDDSSKKDETNKSDKSETKKDEVKKDDKTTSTQKPSTNEKTDTKTETSNSQTNVSKPTQTTPTVPENNITISKPETKPTTPETKPETKPEQNTTSTTVGNTLLSAFKSKASTGADVLTIANALVSNPIIEFAGDAVEVEPGLLTGFRNTKITGFKKGAQFGPIIGSIPFVGYVFELEEGTDASSFISTLRNSANLRWNVCTEADEMITGSSGNKVFFVMCKKSFDDEE